MKPQTLFAWVVSLSLLMVIGMPAISIAQNSKTGTEFFDSSQIRPGLRGFTKICFNGSEIHKIEVEVISLVGQRSPDAPHNYYGFIARISGPIIDITHGISDGASGAPVYFNNKLAGAITGLVDYDFGAHDLISCRTIEEALKLFDYPSFKPEIKLNNQPEAKPDEKLELNPPIKVEGKTISSITYSRKSSDNCAAINLCAKKVRVYNKDKDYDPFIPWWKRYRNLALAPTYSDQTLPLDKLRETTPLQPGSPVSIVLSLGDVNWLITGTLTYVAPDGKFLAFGHDIFDRAGSIDLPLASTHLITTITNMNRFIAMAKGDNIIGSVLEDRREGVAGKLGNWNGKWVPISVKTQQITEKRGLTLNFELPQSIELTWQDVREMYFYAARRAIDNYGDISVEVKTKLTLNTNPEKVISFRNCYSKDPFGIIFNDFNQITSRLEVNDRQLIFPSKLEMEIVTVQGRNSAFISNVELLNDKNEPIKPKENGQFTVTKGEDLRVKVYLQYYNGKLSEAVHTIKWPADDKKFGPGSLNLQVFGGNGLSALWGDTTPQIHDELASYQNRFINVKDVAAPITLDDVYTDLLPDYQNDNLVIQLINTKNELRATNGEMANHVNVLVPKANFIINGFKRFDLEVVAPTTIKTPTDTPPAAK